MTCAASNSFGGIRSGQVKECRCQDSRDWCQKPFESVLQDCLSLQTCVPLPSPSDSLPSWLESGFKVDSSLQSNQHGGGSVGGHEGYRIVSTCMAVTRGHFVTWGAVVCARN